MINSAPAPAPLTASSEEQSCDREAVDRIVAAGPSGALVLAGIAIAIVLALWFAFYLFVFLARAPAP